MTDTIDIPQLDTIDALLDTLTDASLLQIYRALLPFDDRMLAAAAVLRALTAGGGGGLPVGWTADTPNEGDFGYAANGRTAQLGPAGDPTDEGSGLHLQMICISDTTIELFGAPGQAYLVLTTPNGSQIRVDTTSGVRSAPDSGNPAFVAGGDTAALDGQGLPIVNFTTLEPTSKPTITDANAVQLLNALVTLGLVTDDT